MSEPRKHHFVPEFLLKRWAGPSARVTAWQREPNGGVRSFPVLPTETAVQRDLYARRAGPPELRNAHERLLNGIETRAAAAIKAAVSGDFKAISDQTRFDLAVFMVATHIRVPERVMHMRTEGRAVIEEFLSRPDPEFDRLNTGPEQNFLEWTLNNKPEVVENFGIDVLPKLINGPSLQKLYAMPWMLAHFAKTSSEVLLSDRPFVIEYGIDHPLHLRTLPLGPRHVLFAATSYETLERLANCRHRDLLPVINRAVVARAHRFAYGRAQTGFIAKHLPRTLPAVGFR